MSEPDLRKGARNTTPVRKAAEKAESRPNSIHYDDPPEESPEEEIIDISHDDSSSHRQATPRQSEDGSRSPAYVAPIPKIGKIPPVSRDSISSTGRPQYPRLVTASLVGKRIDEFGDVMSDDGTTVLGRVAGDLPSMVGRMVANTRGDVFSDDGELLGYVAEVETEKKQAPGSGGEEEEEEAASPKTTDAPPRSTQPLDEYMARNKSAFRINERGEILDGEDNIVGSFHDFNRMGPKPAGPAQNKESEKPASSNETKPSGPSGQTASPQQSEEEKRPNAQSYRKENESPSDIFLDVKSTTEGIQLTIRIPTVFPGGGQPRVQFS